MASEPATRRPLRALLIEDQEDDAALVVRHLRRHGFDVRWERVDSAEALHAQLDDDGWDVVVADYMIPGFSGLAGLHLIRERGLDLPYLLVSGSLGEEVAVEAMREGAADYIMKDNLIRLGPAIDRELREAAERRSRREAEEQLRASEARMRKLLRTAVDAIVTVDSRGVVRSLNPAAEQMFAQDEERVVGRHVDVLLPDLDLRGPGREDEVSAVARRPDGSELHVALTVSRTDHEGETHLTIIARDVTERVAFESQLEHQALHDPLTGLPNRSLLKDRLGQAIAELSRNGRAVAVLFLDLDRFKYVNDSLGHHVGDEVLEEMGRRLSSLLRPSDTVARFGGDEFVLLCRDLDDGRDAAQIAHRVLRTVAEPLPVGGISHRMTASVGIALTQESGTPPEALLRDADAAMYRAKERGKNRFELFDDTMRRRVLDRLQTETALYRGADEGQFRAWVQPIIDLRTTNVVGFEALARWQHPTRGLLLPADFLTTAVETGHIVPIGHMVIDQACRWLAQLERVDGEHPGLLLSVNLSSRQLSDRDLVPMLSDTVARAGVQPHQIVLELTEQTLIEDDQGVHQTTTALIDCGFRLAVDDFGTGYSAMSYLKRFPLEYLKIDREFTSGLGQDAEDTAIVRAICAMGEALDLCLIAEGVETETQAEELRGLGCELAQGHHYARAAPADREGVDRAVRQVAGALATAAADRRAR